MAPNPLTGIPPELLPAAGVRPDRCTVVRSGPRNLEARPFDFRNPFALHDLTTVNADVVNGANSPVRAWPVEDAAGEFDYYANGNAALGLPDGPECALVDHFGTLRSFTGAWACGVGPSATALPLRVRRLEDGRRPIVLASARHGDAAINFTWCAGAIPGAPAAATPVWSPDHPGCYSWVGGPAPSGRNIFLAMRLDLAAGPALSVLLGYAQKPALCAGAFYTGAVYAPAWDRVWMESAGRSNWRLLATTGESTFTLGFLSAPGSALAESPDAIAHWPDALPKAPARPAAHHARLEVAASNAPRHVEWIIPMFPLPRKQDACLLRTSANALRRSGRRAWQARRAAGLQLAIPEAKVDNAFAQALNHLDLCLVTLDQTQFPTPGPSGGHHIFYERDAIDLIHAYDIVGDHARAARMIDHYALHGVGQESSGMVLWLLGKHWSLTQDRAWLAHAMPEAERRMAWLIRTWIASRDKNDGLLPETEIGDNELTIGHFVSYHLYALAGARAGVALARAAGAASLARQWQAFLTPFEKAVMAALEKLVEKTGGIITPTFEGFDSRQLTFTANWMDPPQTLTFSGAYGKTGGCDWHNIAAAFPTEVLPAGHPWITSSIARWRHTYVEGVFPYPRDQRYDWIHNYNTLNLSETFLRRGDWAEALRDLYGVLLHTTAAHASAEVVDSRCRRDMNCTPHNWFSAKLVRFIRDLLVYEGDDRRLHLFGGLSPAWLRPGQSIGLHAAPTELGSLSLDASVRSDGMDLRVSFRPRPACRGLAIHLPPFLKEVTVKAGGRTVPAHSGTWILPAATRRVDIRWKPQPLPDLSFDRVVESYIEDHRRRTAAIQH